MRHSLYLRRSTHLTYLNNPSVVYCDISLDRFGSGTIKDLATGNNSVMHRILAVGFCC